MLPIIIGAAGALAGGAAGAALPGIATSTAALGGALLGAAYGYGNEHASSPTTNESATVNNPSTLMVGDHGLYAAATPNGTIGGEIGFVSDRDGRKAYSGIGIYLRCEHLEPSAGVRASFTY